MESGSLLSQSEMRKGDKGAASQSVLGWRGCVASRYMDTVALEAGEYRQCREQGVLCSHPTAVDSFSGINVFCAVWDGALIG